MITPLSSDAHLKTGMDELVAGYDSVSIEVKFMKHPSHVLFGRYLGIEQT